MSSANITFIGIPALFVRKRRGSDDESKGMGKAEEYEHILRDFTSRMFNFLENLSASAFSAGKM